MAPAEQAVTAVLHQMMSEASCSGDEVPSGADAESAPAAESEAPGSASSSEFDIDYYEALFSG